MDFNGIAFAYRFPMYCCIFNTVKWSTQTLKSSFGKSNSLKSTMDMSNSLSEYGFILTHGTVISWIAKCVFLNGCWSEWLIGCTSWITLYPRIPELSYNDDNDWCDCECAGRWCTILGICLWACCCCCCSICCRRCSSAELDLNKLKEKKNRLVFSIGR